MVAHRNGNTGPNSRIDIGLNGIGKNSIDLAPLCVVQAPVQADRNVPF
jgi:hypothetical protein